MLSRVALRRVAQSKPARALAVATFFDFFCEAQKVQEWCWLI